MDYKSKEQIIKELYASATKNTLPNKANKENDYFFDEGTGTWYLLTGKRQMERPAVENAKRYFEQILETVKMAPVGSESYEKALYCAIAIESINYFINKK